MMDNQAANVDELQALLASGKRPRFVFFWGHKPKRSGALGAECCSQWFGAPFEEDGVRYPTSEHYMMAEKARLFGDNENRKRILGAGKRVLAEASPKDRIWGIGLPASDPRAKNPLQWKGSNLLGFALMRVRELLEATNAPM